MLTPDTCSPDTLRLWSYLPADKQASDEANGYPFLSWLEGAGSILQVIDDLARDDSDGNPGWSILLDPTRCPTYALPWQAQTVGVRFGANQTTDAQMRSAIMSEAGFQRGTPAALLASVNSQLLPGYSATLIERTNGTTHEPDPYAFILEVPSAGVNCETWASLVANYGSWTALVDAFATWETLATDSAAFVDSILAAKPAGLLMTVNFI